MRASTPASVRPPIAWRHWVEVGALLLAATLCAAWLDHEVSLTSQAMIYLLVVAWVAYRFGWLESAICAVTAVTAFNFFFVPPRWTLAVEHHEHFIAIAAMLAVGLVISHLSTRMRRESEAARLSEGRAHQVQALASELAGTTVDAEVLQAGRAALKRAFGDACVVVPASDDGELPATQDLRDGLRACMREAAVLGPGTARWPGLDAWYVPLGDKGRVVGAACVKPAVAADVDGREHAAALCMLMAQALWRLRLASGMLAAQAAVQRHQVQATLLAAVSHDLRTPLAAIVGAASSLQSQRERLPPAEQDRLLASIAAEASYLASVTENTLQLVRLSGGELELRRDWESIEEIVGAVLSRLRQRDPGRRIKSRVPAGLPLVKADPVLLSQLLANLLDNALKYSDGPVDLNVNADKREALTIEVKDRGPGFDGAQAEQLFEPFVRGAHSQGERGAGLGLAVCRAIAHAHGGSLSVRRRSGGGSSFSLSLPVELQQPVGELPK